MSDRNNTLTFDSSSTFYVESGGTFLREDKPGSLRKGNTVRIQGVRGIFRVVDVYKPQGKLTIEVEKIHGEALFWVRNLRTSNVFPVEAVVSPRENDPMVTPVTEYLIPGHGFVDASGFIETQDPNLADVSQARTRNPKPIKAPALAPL